VDTAPFTGKGKSSVFADRKSFAPPTVVPAQVTLAPKESLAIVSGEDHRLHKPGFVGWKPFLEYFQNHKDEFATSPAKSGAQ